MKRLLYSIGLLLLTVACERDIFPNNRLYQRWRLERTRQGDGPWVIYNMMPIDTEYRPDGILVYRVDGQIIGSCCKPNRFRRRENEISFVNDVVCPYYVLCAGPLLDKSIITQLTGDSLELTTGQRVTQYRAVK